MYPSAKADGFSLLPLGGENFRPHYIRPCEDRPLPDGPRCVQIGMGFVPTRDAMEGGLGGAVLLVDAAARRALARRVAGIDKTDRDTGALRLVGEEAPHLAERPIPKPRSLVAASGRYPATDARQSFHGDPASGAFSVAYKRLRYAVVDVLLVSPLSAGQFTKSALGRLGAALLQATAALLDMPTTPFHLGAGVQAPIAVCGERDDAEVHAKPILGLEFLGLRHIAGRGQEPFTADKAQIDLAFAERHQPLLVLAHHDGEHHAAFQGPQADRSPGLDEAQDAVVVRLRGVPAEDGGDGAVDFEGVGYLGDRPHHGLSRQPEAGPHLGIGHLVHVVLAPRVGGMPGGRKPRRCFVAPCQRRPQALGLVGGRQEFHGGHKLHAVKYRAPAGVLSSAASVARPAIPPSPEGGGFSRRTP